MSLSLQVGGPPGDQLEPEWPRSDYDVCGDVYLQDAALQCSQRWCAGLEDREELLKHLLDWALAGFPALGPERPAAAGRFKLRLLFVTIWAC